MITENLTKIRYDLLKKSLEILGRKSCWTIDGRILTKRDNEIVEIKGWSPEGQLITMQKGEVTLLNC